jgi:hypothetical protein
VRDIFAPHTDKTILTWEQLSEGAFGRGLQDRILLELDVTNALCPSELLALRWKCLDQANSKMYRFETACKSVIRPWDKTKKSLGECIYQKSWRTTSGSGARTS